MEEIQQMSHELGPVCLGCGAEIQSENERNPGYVPASAIGKEGTICRRCFRIKHYNEVAEVSLTDADFRRILHGIGSSDALVVKIVDLFDFNGSLIPGLHRYIGNNPLLFVGNKLDLLPKQLNTRKMKHWMKVRAHEWGLKPVDVVMVSGLKGHNLQELVDKVEILRKGRDVYVVGATNVGKSTVINRLLKDYGAGDGSDLELTTSRFPGTTLDLIEIPLDQKSSLYDTPGVINTEQIIHMLSPQEIKSVMPTKQVNPKIYQLREEQTLFLGGFARLDFVQGAPQSFVIYISNEIPIHRTKLEKADQLYREHAGELLSPPSKETVAKLPAMQKHFFSLQRGEKKDLVISGLGWVTLQGEAVKIEVHVPKGVAVQIRQSLI